MKLTPTKFGPLLDELSEADENDTDEPDSDLAVSERVDDPDYLELPGDDETSSSDAESFHGFSFSDDEEGNLPTRESPGVGEGEEGIGVGDEGSDAGEEGIDVGERVGGRK